MQNINIRQVQCRYYLPVDKKMPAAYILPYLSSHHECCYGKNKREVATLHNDILFHEGLTLPSKYLYLLRFMQQTTKPSVQM